MPIPSGSRRIGRRVPRLQHIRKVRTGEVERVDNVLGFAIETWKLITKILNRAVTAVNGVQLIPDPRPTQINGRILLLTLKLSHHGGKFGLQGRNLRIGIPCLILHLPQNFPQILLNFIAQLFKALTLNTCIPFKLIDVRLQSLQDLINTLNTIALNGRANLLNFTNNTVHS
ncbi:uncharacterized protein BcabD6B2_25360 [Babesia caballi]|uniref:Uncharacterized protein n=1 Tax=Babesia caballi TaxID=5871 RepID=A0AAV4LVH4_BABCB|nr:hypothetical protein BcabD6B2_25360 [Babesia caballi]